MQTFEVTLDPVAYTEILQGAAAVAFDATAAVRVEIYLTETASDPGDVEGNLVASWPQSWDFQAVGMEQPGQYIWARGSGVIRGVR